MNEHVSRNNHPSSSASYYQPEANPTKQSLPLLGLELVRACPKWAAKYLGRVKVNDALSPTPSAPAGYDGGLMSGAVEWLWENPRRIVLCVVKVALLCV